jgi:hypothetical protein
VLWKLPLSGQNRLLLAEAKIRTVKKMSSIVSRIAVAVAVALIAFGLGLFPKEGMKGLAKGLAVTISLVVIAAFLITAARSTGP